MRISQEVPLFGVCMAGFLATLWLTFSLTPAARMIAIRVNAVDRPAGRKLHSQPVPQLGGVAIIVAFALTTAAGGLFLDRSGSSAPLAAILAGALVLGAMGLWDDIKVVPGWVKVPVELALGAALYAAGARAELFEIWPLDLALTMGWVIGITNAVNYMDNMDGLSAGTSAIAGAYFAVLGAFSGQLVVAALSSALAGCALGFLWHNRAPARIFMGDAGSLFLGFMLAGLGLELRFANIQSVTFFVPIAVMAVPILDALLVSVSRVRKGLSPIQPGRDHISHRLASMGLPTASAVGLLWLASAATGWIGLTIATAHPRTAYMLMAWMVAVGSFLAAWFLRVEP